MNIHGINREKTTISGIPDRDRFVNYNKNSDMSGITDPNAIGTITVNDTGEVKGNITPLIMIINSSGEGWETAVENLVRVGADPDMMINYYGRDTSAREIADNYRGGFPSISARGIIN